MFSALFGYWVGGGGGAPKGMVHNLLMQFFTLDSSKIEVFETYFFDILITHLTNMRKARGKVYTRAGFLTERSQRKANNQHSTTHHR